MNIVNLLEKAIKNQDWSYVEKACKLLGGNITPIKSETRNKKSKTKIKTASPKKQSVINIANETIGKDGMVFITDNNEPKIDGVPEPKRDYRPEFNSKMIQCSKCNKNLLKSEASKISFDDSQKASYLCNKCLIKSR